MKSISREVTIVEKPTIFVVADMRLRETALEELEGWLAGVDPDCLELGSSDDAFHKIFPHEGREEITELEDFARSAAEIHGSLYYRNLTGNELLVELAGRGCYRSYGKKAGRKSNAEYISNLFGSPGKIPHASVLYHAKMTFFFGGLSRRVSHELIRHYVGADRDEEGSPSQESTRFTHHPGHFVIHPRDAEDHFEREQFRKDSQRQYDTYLAYVARQMEGYKEAHGTEPKGMDRKRIYESAATRLQGAAATSFYWTTNPMALAKILWERGDNAADLEIQRFAEMLREVCYREWPNLFRGSNLAALAAAADEEQANTRKLREAQTLADSFREELVRISDLLKLPASTHLDKDLAPALEQLLKGLALYMNPAE